ncbi:MAG: hypothetical protein AAF195_05010 [Pseudomonadota bacterium]
MKQKSTQEIAHLINENINLKHYLESWVTICASQVCPIEIIVDNLNKVNNLIEQNVNNINQDFLEIASNIQKQSVNLQNICENNKKTANIDNELMNEISQEINIVNENINKIVTSMQFQDRVTQNIDVTNNVLKLIIQYVKNASDNTSNSLNQATKPSNIDKDFTTKIMNELHLGDLRNNFTQYLISQGLIDNTSEIGYVHPQEIDNHVHHLDDDNIDDEGIDLF